MTPKQIYAASQKLSYIKIGDTVEVLRKAGDYELGWGTWWVEKMTSKIGKSFKVISVSENFGFQDSDGFFIRISFSR